MGPLRKCVKSKMLLLFEYSLRNCTTYKYTFLAHKFLFVLRPSGMRKRKRDYIVSLLRLLLRS